MISDVRLAFHVFCSDDFVTDSPIRQRTQCSVMPCNAMLCRAMPCCAMRCIERLPRRTPSSVCDHPCSFQHTPEGGTVAASCHGRYSVAHSATSTAKLPSEQNSTGRRHVVDEHVADCLDIVLEQPLEQSLVDPVVRPHARKSDIGCDSQTRFTTRCTPTSHRQPRLAASGTALASKWDELIVEQLLNDRPLLTHDLKYGNLHSKM